MFRLAVKKEFSAAHSLREYQGKCEGLHGHNWKVEAVVSAKGTDSRGLVLDFHDIKKILNNVLEELDHKHLNNISYFKKINPTSENIAKYIFKKATDKLQSAGCKLQEITVWESDNCSATYFK